MKVKVLGKIWNLREVDGRELPGADGDCSSPEAKFKEIRIRRKLDLRRRRVVLIHELLHAADWHKDESWVETVAEDIERALWKVESNGVCS